MRPHYLGAVVTLWACKRSKSPVCSTIPNRSTLHRGTPPRLEMERQDTASNLAQAHLASNVE